MPIYEYECSACGHKLEAIQKMSEKALTECPECHGQTLNKLISAAGFQLKGTGWYATDFRNKGKPEKPSSTKTENKTETKTETKTDSSSTSTKSTDSKDG